MEVVPQLVEDVSLKRSRVQLEGGGEAIKVIGVGSNVSITPTLVSGTKIADYSIDETPGVLYAPNGGVGQAYPDSTGGEIFNYYGTDANENIASASYSTAMGYHNQVKGPYGFAAGSDNSISQGVANSMTLGTNNSCFHLKTISLGNNLTTTAANQTLVGRYNNTTTALSAPHFVVGVGDSSNSRNNAIECNTTFTKVCNALQLANNSTAVTSIVPPEDPDYPETDELTLATKAYVDKRTKIGVEEDTSYSAQAGMFVTPGDDFDTYIGFGAIVVFKNTNDDKTYSFVYINTGYSQTIEVGGCTFTCSSGYITSGSANPILRNVVVLQFYHPS